MRTCKLCSGTGKIVTARSWFTSDGFRFIRCGFCKGEGETRVQASPEWVRDQNRLREIFCIAA